jgi:hypothetical protein
VVKVSVSVFGPLVIATGIAMLVLPGPGLVVMALGAALLAMRSLHTVSREAERAQTLQIPPRCNLKHPPMTRDW